MPLTEKSESAGTFHPHVVWSSLARTDNHGFLAPCMFENETGNGVQSGRSFTSVQMFHTHTHLYRKAFRIVDLECIMRANQQQERETRQKGGSEYSLAF